MQATLTGKIMQGRDFRLTNGSNDFVQTVKIPLELLGSGGSACAVAHSKFAIKINASQRAILSPFMAVKLNKLIHHTR